ncbi:2,3-bisphosphoglycerate-independent phosphoglycerate mutase [Limisalsivibrio acetivorans]|uniref:2,3-bisphosphoglycerate-independent phosphoglycerate mutase n=1 Tax=Limisalsivibrio acetivorans TaxID=1304888 RepID=UPI0003B5C712|nr:2,3-bisphosphoglycerate-independent phosphoglycerate mutase [Limisalsivibrio acetivorans]
MKRLILLILDGWGYREDSRHNAVHISNPVNFNRLWANSPKTLLNASEESVGLPPGQMGNSEVGHTNIGAGRIVYQDFLKINMDVESGEIRNNANIKSFFEETASSGGRLHFFGLLSDGGVHSHIKHLKGLISFAKDIGVEDIFVHAFMDGRDTPPKSGIEYMKELEAFLAEQGVGRVATVSGRYYAMDRDKRWDRIEQAYRAVRRGEGLKADTGAQAVSDAYARGETDEFIRPTIIDDAEGDVRDGDSGFFFNFRADRARELTEALNEKDFDGFERVEAPQIKYMTMTRYEKDYPYPVAYPPAELNEIFGEVVSAKGLKQLRIAETEKYAHVTYFFNGGRELVFDGELRELIPSPKDVPTYDKKPEMSVETVADTFEDVFINKGIDVAVMNFANPDMVGHSGVEEAAVAACAAVDKNLGRVMEIAERTGSILVVTADHGNCEQMWDFENDQPHTAHTLNPVPFAVYNHECRIKDKRGKLADIAPTLLDMLGIEKPEAMTGESLLEK